MRVIITGGAGLLGQKLTLALLNRKHLSNANGVETEIKQIVLFDRVAPQSPLLNDSRLKIVTGDIASAQSIRQLLTANTGAMGAGAKGVGAIFHLAAVLSGESEQNFELGMRVNLLAAQNLLEACRQLVNPPRFIFASSIAVYGGDLPSVIEDGTILTPQSSYGTQKAVIELLVNDYSRKGFIDGRSVRLPTIVVRPGKPNKATSTFASSIIREPLQGQPAICPVSPDTRMWIMSPRRAVENFIQAAKLPPEAWGSSRAVSLPGLSVSIQEMVDTLQAVAGSSLSERISWQPDPFIQNIVGSWPDQFAPNRAEQLGFKADDSMQGIIEAFIEDELGGNLTFDR